MTVSSHYNHDPRHYTFQRTQSLYTPPLEAVQPISGYFTETMRVVGVTLLVAILAFLGWALSGIFVG